MARPHPVGALFNPANFLHIRHMFMAEEMLLCPSWHCSFSGVRVFVVNMCTSVMHPPVAFMFAGSSRFTFAGLSCTPYPKRVTFLVFRWFPSNTTYAALIFWIENILLFLFLLSFLGGGYMDYVSSWCIKTLLLCFLATSEVNFVALGVVAFFHAFFPCWSNLILWCFLIWLLF